LYANNFEQEKTVESLARHILWLDDPNSTRINDDILRIYVRFYYQHQRSGMMYLAGRDKQYRPTLVINIAEINPEMDGRLVS